MPRIARIVAVGYPHHITQRGNYQQKTFVETADYFRYIRWLNEYSEKHNLSLCSFCLMPNHVHFIAIPNEDDSLSKTFSGCHTRYANYFNKKNKTAGHLWQGRFYSCVLDEAHLYAAIKYVENNPVRSGLVKSADEWEWSSAKFHINGSPSPLALSNINNIVEISNWKEFLCQSDDKTTAMKIKANTLSGKPLGSEAFVLQLEEQFGRKFTSAPVGRPKNGVCH